MKARLGLLARLGIVGVLGGLAPLTWGIDAASASSPVCGIMAVGDRGGYAICDKPGIRQLRVKLECYDPVRDIISVTYGPWVAKGKKSSATCIGSNAAPRYPGGIDIQTR